MAKTAPEDKYKQLKRATITSGAGAIFIFLIDSFVIGAPTFSFFAAIYVVFYLLPVTLFSIKNRPKLRFFGNKLMIYGVLVVASFGFYTYDISMAEQKADRIIAAVDRYYLDHGSYPLSLPHLVPDYLPEIPKPRIAPGIFYYVGAPNDPHLMYSHMPPFGRMSWSFKDKKWIELD